MAVDKGDLAPDFTLPADDGSTVQLSKLRGKKVILYFYPKDDTSGCTRQACDLRDELHRIDEAGAVVLGVSPDDVASHKKFKEKYQLNFPLLADTEKQAADAYDVWKKKSMYGRTFLGIERSTFIIDEKGVIQEAWRKVSAADHAGKVLETLAT
jgi:thioredoxin-dependent peroxiredoxin